MTKHMEGSLAIINPFQIDLILEHVFRFCDFQQLKEVRLVCKTWYEASLSKWRQSGPFLNLKKERDCEAFLETFYSDDDTSHHNSSSYYYLRGIQQYQKFSLSYLGSFLPETKLNLFWNAAGAWITSLELKDITTGLKLEAYKAIMFCKFTPRLETLKIIKEQSYLEYSESESYDLSELCEEIDNLNKNLSMKSLTVSFHQGGIWDRGLGISWTELLAHYPNLKSLSLSNCGSKWRSELDRVLNAIVKVRRVDHDQQRNLAFLESLDIIHLKGKAHQLGLEEFPSALVTFFRKEVQISLRHLSLDLGHVTPSTELYSVLSQHAKSLETLTLLKYNSVMAMNFQLPELKSLKRLEMILGCPFQSFITCFKSVPNLNSLVFKDVSSTGRQDEAPGESMNKIIVLPSESEMKDVAAVPRLTTFSSSFRTPTGHGPEEIHRLAGWMPNLKTLELHLEHPELVSLACQVFPKLEDLVVFKLTSLQENNSSSDELYDVPEIRGLKSFAVVPIR